MDDDLGFGSFASFFRNYKWQSSAANISVQGVGNIASGEYRFDDTVTDEWAGELTLHTAPAGYANAGYNYNSSLKTADHSGLDDATGDAETRYGVFNSSGKQTKGSVWFIDGGPYSGKRYSVGLLWSGVDPSSGNSTGIIEGVGTSNYSRITIAMGGIYDPRIITEDSGGGNQNSNFFNIGRAINYGWYNGQSFNDLVSKFSGSVKFRFKEDPTGEIYTINPGGVDYSYRLRWSDGGRNGGSEYPAYKTPASNVGPDFATAVQLSPNMTSGFDIDFRNDRTGDETVSWDPTNGGATGPIPGGLKLRVDHSTTIPNQVVHSSFMLVVDDITDITCDVHQEKYSITEGMILTGYSSVTLGGNFVDNGGTSYSY